MNDKSYNNWNALSDEAIVRRIGDFVKWHRLQQNTSQQGVAEAAGISRSTLSLLERGETVRLDTLIQVLRVLDELHVLDAFAVEDEISPIAYAKLKKKERKKASPQPFNSDEKTDIEW
ncbi:MAG: helix-turn-helix domain-containing protein [Bacteroidetes bacterium]|jgi:transcriptional regulator with XRE-family HTH domain|nr:helix-turn-helix domain-containing protein [Bacteroidota bacterium]